MWSLHVVHVWHLNLNAIYYQFQSIYCFRLFFCFSFFKKYIRIVAEFVPQVSSFEYL